MHKEFYYSQYSHLDGADDGSDDTKLLDSGIAISPPPKSRFLRLWPWLSHGILMSMTLVFFTLWARAPSIDDIVLFSPANEAVESIGIVILNGSIGATSIYSGSPSPELDATWDNLAADARSVRMTSDQLLRAREKISPAMSIYPDEYGGGYMATIEAIHLLHCTDMLRRASWGDYYKAADYAIHDSPEAYRTHLDHCIEILRQDFMCRGDVTMITYDWVEGVEAPFPNFNIPHQCRNFEKILDWVDENRVIVPTSDMFAPNGGYGMDHVTQDVPTGLFEFLLRV